MRPERLIHGFVFVAAVTVLPGMEPSVGCYEDDALVAMERLEVGLEKYWGEWRTYPERLDDLRSSGHVTVFDGISDPFGNRFYYRRLETGVGYELFSTGPDGAPRTLDDVIPGQRPQFCTRRSSLFLYEYRAHGPHYLPCNMAMGWVRTLEVELRTFRSNAGGYPDSLLELNSMMTDGVFWGAPRMFIDPWGTPYSYTRLGSQYELYSNGPDGVSGTGDDVVPDPLGCDYPPFYRSRRDLDLDPRFRARALSSTSCGMVSHRLINLMCEIDHFRSTHGKLPKALTDLIDGENVSQVRRLTDPWGQLYSYKPLRSGVKQRVHPPMVDPDARECPRPPALDGYVLFSNGPDQLPNTHDDLVYGFDTEKCWQPPFDAISFQEVHAAQRAFEYEMGDVLPVVDASAPNGVPVEADASPPIVSPQGGCSFRGY